MRNFTKKFGVGILSLGLVCSVGFAADAKAPVAKQGFSAKLASVTPVAGYEEASFGGSLVFVAANSALGAGEIVAGRMNTNEIVLTLNAEGATAAANLVRSNAGARLAVYEGTRIVAAPVIEASMLKGTNLTVSTAPIAPSGPTISVVATKATANPGELVSFDVFLSSAADLRGYQVALEATGGTNGKLILSDINQDTSRADFVFGSAQILNASDLNGGRVVGALFNGTTDVTSQKYLGTFTYLASPDAAGSFTVKLRVSEDTALRDSASAPIGYQAGSAATVRIGNAR